MDLRSAVDWKTNWTSSVSLEKVFSIKSSSGIILDEPLSNQDTPPLLSKSASKEPCYIYVDCGRLRGYNVVGLCVTSGSRTIECYGPRPDNEYIGTTRGVPCGQANEFFKCTVDLPPNNYTTFTLKLVSLQGKTQVSVAEVEVIVTENRGGDLVHENNTSVQTPTFPTATIQDLMSTLSSESVPAFLPGLISSLQDIEKSSPIDSMDKLSQLSSIFRLMRPPVKENVSHTTTDDEQEYVHDDDDGAELESNIDKHVLEYIDKKFNDLENKMEERIKQLKEEIISSILERL